MKKRVNIQKDIDSRRNISMQINRIIPEDKEEIIIEGNATSEVIQEPQANESPVADEKQEKGRRKAKRNT